MGGRQSVGNDGNQSTFPAWPADDHSLRPAAPRGYRPPPARAIKNNQIREGLPESMQAPAALAGVILLWRAAADDNKEERS
jgi:hypothetical protein